MSLSEIVNVIITRETVTVSRAGFGTLLIVGPDVNVNSRLEYFTDAASAKLRLIGASPFEEELIDAAFAQSPSVTRIALGALATPKIGTFTGAITVGNILGYIDDTEYTQAFITDEDTTMAALATQMQAHTNVVTAVWSSPTLTVTPVVGQAVRVTYDITGATGYTAVAMTSGSESETYDEALDAILAEQPDWYGITAVTRTISKQELIADWSETNKKFYIAGTADTNVINQTDAGDSTSIAYYVKANSLDRTAVVYGANAATQGNEAAFFGKLLPLDPGTYTAMFKVLATITVDQLTPTQSTNARAKYANTYESIGGVNITREGKVGSGEYIDIIVFIDWLKARITESVFATLVRVPKVPYTTDGILAIESAVDAPLAVGQNRGGISPQAFDENNVQIGGYRTEVPLLADVPSVDKTNRILNDVKFTAWLSGAIHAVVVNGVVTV